MFPVLVIAIGIVVLALGKRLAVLVSAILLLLIMLPTAKRLGSRVQEKNPATQ